MDGPRRTARRELALVALQRVAEAEVFAGPLTQLMDIRVPVNGDVALRLELDGELEAVAAFSVDGGRVTHAYIVRNPHKLAAMADESTLTRA